MLVYGKYIRKRNILPSRSHDCLKGRHDVSFCLPHPGAVSVFIICSVLYVITEMM